MGYPSTVDSGGVPELITTDEVISVTGVATSTLTGNTVYLYAFKLSAPTTYSGAKWRMGATVTGTTDIGIYDFATGTKQASLGATTNVASTNMSANFSGGNIQLSAGQYFMAMTVSNSTDTPVTNAVSNPGIQSYMRQATNAASAGVLPSTLGGYSDTPARFPSFGLTVVGGLT